MKFSEWSQLFAGIALFIFAMSLLEDALKQLSGRPFKKFLQQQTNHKFRALLGGTIVTAVLQSSSVVLLMVLSFVGAGVMSMRNALAVTLGANLGTTLDSWLLATLGFKVELELLAYPMLILSLVLRLLFSRNYKFRQLCNFLLGFSLLFVALEWMKLSVHGLVASVDMSRYASLSPYLLILFGIVFTAIIQSSYATFAITLTALYNGVITFPGAAGIVIGAEIGTTLKILLGSLDSSADKKRVALGNFMFNIFLSVGATILLYPIIYCIQHILQVKDPLIGLVIFQSGINLLSIIVVYPFIGKFADVLEHLYKGDEEYKITRYIHEGEKQFSDDALKTVEKEVARLVMHTIRFNKILFEIKYATRDKTWIESLKELPFFNLPTVDHYKSLKQLQGKILEYILDIRKEEMAPEELEQAGKLITVSRNTIHAAKKIKDIEHNLQELKVTVNDALHGLFKSMQQSEMHFYDQLQEVLFGNKTEQPFELWKQQDGSYFEKSEEEVLRLLNQDKIEELDASTMLNVFREIQSSHKSLFAVLEDLKLL